MSVRITAVICTYNRCAYLAKAIASLLRQSLPVDEYEVLVVDNASNDGTRRLVSEWGDPAKRLRYVYEPVVGLSQARNTGWRNARGDFVAYLDDDAVAIPEWLERIVGAFETVKPMPGCVGGKVVPLWEAARPPWLGDDLVFCLGTLDLSPVPRVSAIAQVIAGGNAAYPREILQRIGGFSPKLGRRGNNLSSNEEIHVWTKIRDLGLTGFYEPAITIYHAIPAAKLRQDWVRKRMFWEGASVGVMRTLGGELTTKDRFMGAMCELGALRPGHRWLWVLLPTQTAYRFTEKCMGFQHLGVAASLLGVVR